MGASQDPPAVHPDLYVRDYLGDPGTLPSRGTAYHSPDIIPMGPNTLDFATATSSFSTDIGQPIATTAVNNIYVRATNLGSTPTSGTVQLCWSRSSLLLDPGNWWEQQLLTATGASSVQIEDASGSTTIAAGALGMGEPPFLLTTELVPVPNDHYCLIAVVQTPRYPVPRPGPFTSGDQFSAWVQQTAGVAWRNVSTNAASNSTQVWSQTFSNPGPGTARGIFDIQPVNYPDGTTIRAQCAHPQCPIDHTEVTAGNLPIAVIRDLPAPPFSSVLTVSATAATGVTLPANSLLRISFGSVHPSPPPPSGAFAEVVRRRRLRVAVPDGLPEWRDIEVVPLGECTLAIAPTGD